MKLIYESPNWDMYEAADGKYVSDNTKSGRAAECACNGVGNPICAKHARELRNKVGAVRLS